MRILLSLFMLFGGLNVILARSIYGNFHDSPTLNWFNDYDYDLFSSIPAPREDFADDQDIELAELFDSLLEPFLVDDDAANTQKSEEILEENSHKDDENNENDKEDIDGNDGLVELFESLLEPFLVDDDAANMQKSEEIAEEISHKGDENNENDKQDIDGNDGLVELFESLLEPFLVDDSDDVANTQKTEEISRKDNENNDNDKEQTTGNDEESNNFNIFSPVFNLDTETEVAKSSEEKKNNEEENDNSKITLVYNVIDIREKEPQEVVALIKSKYADNEEFTTRVIHEYFNILNEIMETNARKYGDKHNDNDITTTPKDDSNEDRDDDDVTTTPKDDSNEDSNDDIVTTTPKDDSNEDNDYDITTTPKDDSNEDRDDDITTTHKDDSNEDSNDDIVTTTPKDDNNEDSNTSDSNENIIFHIIDADDQTKNLNDHKYEILNTETSKELQTTTALYTPEIHTSFSNLDNHNIIQEYVELRQDLDTEEESMQTNKHILDKDFYGIISNNFNGESVKKFEKDIFVVDENLDRIKRNVNALQNLNSKVYLFKVIKDAQRNFK